MTHGCGTRKQLQDVRLDQAAAFGVRTDRQLMRTSGWRGERSPEPRGETRIIALSASVGGRQPRRPAARPERGPSRLRAAERIGSAVLWEHLDGVNLTKLYEEYNRRDLEAFKASVTTPKKDNRQPRRPPKSKSRSSRAPVRTKKSER